MKAVTFKPLKANEKITTDYLKDWLEFTIYNSHILDDSATLVIKRLYKANEKKPIDKEAQCGFMGLVSDYPDNVCFRGFNLKIGVGATTYDWNVHIIADDTVIVGIGFELKDDKDENKIIKKIFVDNTISNKNIANEVKEVKRLSNGDIDIVYATEQTKVENESGRTTTYSLEIAKAYKSAFEKYGLEVNDIGDFYEIKWTWKTTDEEILDKIVSLNIDKETDEHLWVVEKDYNKFTWCKTNITYQVALVLDRFEDILSKYYLKPISYK